MQEKSLFKNSLYKSILSFANIVIPIIIGPYITRLLNVELYGAYNKAFAEFQVFIIFASFGIYNYGVREISKIRSDSKEVSRLFTNLFVLGLLTNIIVGIIYIIYVLNTSKGVTTTIYLVFLIQIVANIFYMEFLNEALENYKFITIKTIIVKILYLISLLTFVRKPDDIIVYAVVISLTVFLNNIISYIYIKQKVKFDFSNLHLLTCVKGLFLVLIISNIDLLYSQLDKIMLGKFVNDVAVTEYFIPYYLVSTLASIPYAVIIVSIPRLSYLLKVEGLESYKRTLKASISSLLFIIVPMNFGIVALADEVIFLYAGHKYAGLSNILALAALIRVIISMESVLTNLVLYVSDKEKIIVRFSFIYGIGNLILNSLLVVLGIFTPFTAMFTTGLVEVALTITQYIYVRTKMHIKVPIITKNNMVYLVLSSCFLLISYIIKMFELGFVLNILFIITVCVILYVGVLYWKKDSSLYIIINKLSNRLQNRGEK